MQCSAHLHDNGIAVAGIKMGDLVRVRASVSRPIYGWGDVDHSSIGPVVSLEPNPKVNPSPKVIVDFPEQHGWRGRVSELEVVVDYSEGEDCTVEKTSQTTVC